MTKSTDNKLTNDEIMYGILFDGSMEKIPATTKNLSNSAGVDIMAMTLDFLIKAKGKFSH